MRGAVFVLLVVVAAFAWQGQADNPKEFISERDSTCWPCHVAWAIPLKTFYTVQPDEVLALTEGEEANYQAIVQSVWATKETSQFLYVEATIDLSNQTGVAFTGSPQPIRATVSGALGNPVPPTDPVTGSIPVLVPNGASRVLLTLQPSDPSHDLRLQVQTPRGDTGIVDNQGPGQSETLLVDGATNIAALGFGNWTVIASLLPIDADKGTVTPVLENTPFAVDVEVDFDVDNVQILVAPEILEKLESTLFSWKLRLDGAPVSGEIGLYVNASIYFEHDPNSGADDLVNVTKQMIIPTRVVADQLLLEAPQDATIVLGPNGPNGPGLARVSEMIGYVSAFLLVASIWTGGIFGKGSRRSLNRWFGSARRRVAYHNLVSYALTLVAIVHTVLFAVDIGALADDGFHWTLGLLWGGIALLAMLLLGVTGALQVPMIRRWNYPTWRWSHLALAIISLVFTAVHLYLDGANFEPWRGFLNYENPLQPGGA